MNISKIINFQYMANNTDDDLKGCTENDLVIKSTFDDFSVTEIIYGGAASVPSVTVIGFGNYNDYLMPKINNMFNTLFNIITKHK